MLARAVSSSEGGVSPIVGDAFPSPWRRSACAPRAWRCRGRHVGRWSGRRRCRCGDARGCASGGSRRPIAWRGPCPATACSGTRIGCRRSPEGAEIGGGAEASRPAPGPPRPPSRRRWPGARSRRSPRRDREGPSPSEVGIFAMQGLRPRPGATDGAPRSTGQRRRRRGAGSVSAGTDVHWLPRPPPGRDRHRSLDRSRRRPPGSKLCGWRRERSGG